MSATGAEARPARVRLTWWRARRLRTARKADAAIAALVVGLAWTAVWAGNKAAQRLSPAGVVSVREILEELQVPRLLPNASLASEAGELSLLWDLASAPRTVVSFYASWCAPCQEELPVLIDGTAEAGNLLIITAADEDPVETRRQLDNLGFGDEVVYYIDVSGAVFEQGKVKSVPTTFLIGRRGRVQERIVGYSEWRAQQLLEKARVSDD